MGRKASGRTPASSASYMIFAAFIDVSIIPFYGFSALVTMKESHGWSTLLTNQALTQKFSEVLFYLATVGGGFHLISLGISIYLVITFRKINNLPPDMNPLEDNLTSRHKRNQSSISTAATMSEKRIFSPLEIKRSSGAAYEDLSRPPSIPFLHTRTLSTNSFSTYKSTPPPSRDLHLNLPSRQYQIQKARSSMADLKRNSGYGSSTPPKRASYTEVPISDTSSQKMGSVPEAWYTADSVSNRTLSPKKVAYQRLHQRYDSSEDISFGLPNPLEANPPTPHHNYLPSRLSHLSEISNNRVSTDIADTASRLQATSPQRENFKAKHYGELKPRTPPVMNNRQSSGNDLGVVKLLGSRDVSGKIAEEGRGGIGNGWGTRFRKTSGAGDGVDA
jgi:hypothetical protein